jgi:hypothetical protein
MKKRSINFIAIFFFQFILLNSAMTAKAGPLDGNAGHINATLIKHQMKQAEEAQLKVDLECRDYYQKAPAEITRLEMSCTKIMEQTTDLKNPKPENGLEKLASMMSAIDDTSSSTFKLCHDCKIKFPLNNLDEFCKKYDKAQQCIKSALKNRKAIIDNQRIGKGFISGQLPAFLTTTEK